MKRPVAVPIALVLALGSGQAHATPPKLSCRARAQHVATALRKLVVPPRVELRAYRVPLVRLKGAAFVKRMPVTLEGSEITSIDSTWGKGVPLRLANQLKTMWRNWRVINPKQRLVKELAAIVQPKTTWRTIVGLLRSLAALGVHRVGLVVAVDDPAPPMPASKATKVLRAWRAKLLAGVDPASRATLLGKTTALQREVEAHWRRATKHCPQISKNMQAVGGLAPEHKARLIIKGVTRALLACRCRADIPTVHARLHLMFHERPSGVVWFYPRAKGRAIARPGNEPWSQVVGRWLRRKPRKAYKGRFIAK